MHRAWIKMKSSLTGKDSKDIVAECERGEDAALESYQEALQEGLPTEVRDVVQRQLSLVRDAHDQIRSLEQSLES